MATHSRNKSKGAFSILSIDTFRSFSRAGSRQGLSSLCRSSLLTIPACREDLSRSPSSLSCNPHEQPSPSTDLTGLTLTEEPKRRHRPLSWLSFKSRRYSRSGSNHLPKDVSTSTMARSVISAPILTSTSNSKVAAVESVNLNPDMTTAVEARHLAEKIEEEKQDRRKFVDVLKNAAQRRKSTNIEESAPLTRRRVETINLYKDKIKNLTGTGGVRRKPTNAGRCDLVHQNSQAALIQAADLSCKRSKAALDDFDADSHFGSLTRSFNSALEKLDFQSNPNLRSRTSIFNMRRPGEQAQPSEMPYTPRPAFAKLEVRNASTDGRVTQLQLSSQTGTYIQAAPIDRPGGVNPLRMHTSPMTMSRPMADEPEMTREQHQAQSEKDRYGVEYGLSKETSHLDLEAEKDEGFEHARIYTPSSNNLSDWAKTASTYSGTKKDVVNTKKESVSDKRAEATPAKKEKSIQHMKSSESLASLDKGDPPTNHESTTKASTITSPLRGSRGTADPKKRYGRVWSEDGE